MRLSSLYATRLIAVSVFAIVGLAGRARAQEEAPQSLVYAVYDGEDGAKKAFQAMQESQKQGVIKIDSYAVVSKDANGRVHVKSTQKGGAKAGAVIGALVGLLGGPAGVAIGAGAGGGIGYLTGNAVGIPREDIDAIKSSLEPNTSAMVVVLDERWAADLSRALKQADAKQTLEHRIAPGTSGQEAYPPPPPSHNEPPHP
jgi:uncharacterized membrane protein